MAVLFFRRRIDFILHSALEELLLSLHWNAIYQAQIFNYFLLSLLMGRSLFLPKLIIFYLQIFKGVEYFSLCWNCLAFNLWTLYFSYFNYFKFCQDSCFYYFSFWKNTFYFICKCNHCWPEILHLEFCFFDFKHLIHIPIKSYRTSSYFPQLKICWLFLFGFCFSIWY